jgi:protein TonB
MKLHSRLPYVAQLCLFSVLGAQAQDSSLLPPQMPSSPTPSSSSARLEDVRVLGARVLRDADSADCDKGHCKLLVANFMLPDNHGSNYGRQIADDLSGELIKLAPSIQVIDRSLLQSFLDKERIPSEQLTDNANRAVGADLNATTVLVGTTKRLDDMTVELSARMLSVSDKDHIGTSATVNLSAPVSSTDLSPSEPYATLPPLTQTSTGESLYPFGAPGVSAPKCTYMPNPPYSEGARKFRISGTLQVEGIINLEGKLENLRIVRGMPGGLNKTALATLQTWRCNPGLKDSKPVAVVVPFQVTFRLY